MRKLKLKLCTLESYVYDPRAPCCDTVTWTSDPTGRLYSAFRLCKAIRSYGHMAILVRLTSSLFFGVFVGLGGDAALSVYHVFCWVFARYSIESRPSGMLESFVG